MITIIKVIKLIGLTLTLILPILIPYYCEKIYIFKLIV